MAINAQVLTEMEVPESYIESLPKVREKTCDLRSMVSLGQFRSVNTTVSNMYKILVRHISDTNLASINQTHVLAYKSIMFLGMI